MKNTTKLLALLMSLTLSVGIASCDRTTSSPVDSTPVPSTPESSTPESSTPEIAYQSVTIANAIEIATQAGDNATEAIYLLTGTIKEISNASYGEMTIYDETGEIYVYGLRGKNNEYFDKLDPRPGKGDIVTILCSLKLYNDTPEVVIGYLQSFEDVPEEPIDLTDYTSMSIQQARDASKDSKVIIEGTVASITHSFGMVPSGLYVVNNGQSIYVYSDEIAGSVSVGNNVEIAGTKTYYVLESEQSNAEKFGYQGMCQLADAILVDKDNATAPFDKSSIPTSTIKDIMDTPFNENITTQVYKVNSLVKKVEGSGFTNYYFNDIDGVTGSYAYSQCSGSDYSWIDQFDNKICTVYLTAHNAKATASDCFYRFVPIAIYDENYQFDVADAPEYVIKYHVPQQFKTQYAANPNLEVITEVSSELLGFEGVSVSYESNNTDVVYFVEEDNKLYMRTNQSGDATVTVTASLNGVSEVYTVSINVNDPESYDYIGVKQAIEAADGTEVTVKGIVTSSLVNKTGFYISDDTGIIAVQCTEEELSKVELGNLVIIKGTRAHNKKETSTTITGQSNIKDATVLVNLFGDNEYNDSYFDNTKTFEDLRALDLSVDYSTTPFVVEGTLSVYKTPYYTTLNFIDENDLSLSLYMSGAGQYAWASEYYNQKVKFEVIPCNWNDKTDYWRFTIISIITEDGKVVNSCNFN